MSEPLKGLMVDVLRVASGGDCSLGGLSSKFARLTLVGAGVAGVFEPTDDMPALILVRRQLWNEARSAKYEYLHAEPLETHGKAWHMFGGNYITDSDSRFPSKQPIPVHDRIEGGR